MSTIEHGIDPGASRAAVFRDADDPSRILALSIYAETGSLLTASRETGIPQSTLHYWLSKEDAADQLESLRLAIRSQTAHKWAGVANLAIDVLLDRLAHGDPVLDKDGVERRIGIKGKDAAFIASIATDKHALITGALVQGAKMDNALASLADRLAQAVTQAAKQAASQVATPVPQAPAPEIG